MADRFSDAQLDAVLASVGRHLVVPAGPRGAATVRTLPARPAVPRPARTVVLVAAAVAVLLLVTGAVVSPVRDAVADWLGIGSTRIEQVGPAEGDPRGLPSLSDGAAPVSPAGAAFRLGRPVPVVADLGPPAQLTAPPEGGVLLAWPRGRTTLWMHADDGSSQVFVKKLLGGTDRATAIRDVGDAAALIEGRHILRTPTRRLAAGRVLIWVDGGLEYRLESDLSRREMIDAARSVSASGR